MYDRILAVGPASVSIGSNRRASRAWRLLIENRLSMVPLPGFYMDGIGFDTVKALAESMRAVGAVLPQKGE